MMNLNTVSDIAKRLGTSEATIYKHIKLNNLDMSSDETIQDFVKKYLDGSFKAGRPLRYKKGEDFMKTYYFQCKSRCAAQSEDFEVEASSFKAACNKAEAEAEKRGWSAANCNLIGSNNGKLPYNVQLW